MNQLLLHNAAWIVTPASPQSKSQPYVLEKLEADSILVEDGKIKWVGFEKDCPVAIEDISSYDLDGLGVTPGLIDFHAHPVFASTRAGEFELRTQGASYAEIAAAGGGILNSAKKLRATGEEDLYERTVPYLDNAIAHGTTTLEAKSGYGLETDAELKMLRVIRLLNKNHPVDLVPTFLGAHEYPPEYRDNHEGYINLLIKEMIPKVTEEKLAVACDIFCETGVFSVEEARLILTYAKKHGLEVKVHADQLTPLGGTKLAVELEALSADHIEFIDDEGIEALAGSSTVAGLLPVAAHFLRMKEDPPVREMINRGVICALATDFNPGSAMSESMQMALHLAVIRFRISTEEAIWMATAGSAKALGLEDRGWIGEGALCDLVAWKAENIREIPYHFGVNLAGKVFKRGELVADNGFLIA